MKNTGMLHYVNQEWKFFDCYERIEILLDFGHLVDCIAYLNIYDWVLTCIDKEETFPKTYYFTKDR